MNNSWNVPSRRYRTAGLLPESLFNRGFAGLFSDLVDIDPAVALQGVADKNLQFVPRIEVAEDAQGFTVRVEVPGMKEEDIDITLTKSELVLSGEKKEEHEDTGEGGSKRSEIVYGKFLRTIPLNVEIDTDSVEALSKDGMLTIKLPKSKKAINEAKKISVRKVH